jgi:hypothetical protein
MNPAQDTRSIGASTESGHATSTDEVVHDLSLLLMYLTAWKERPDFVPRFWKGFLFEVLDRLELEGLVSQSHRAKSAYLTDAGVRRAQELLAEYGLGAADPERSTPG